MSSSNTPDSSAGANSQGERSRDSRSHYRLYGKADKIARSFLKRIQGPFCAQLGCPLPWTDIHHVDGDVSNYDANNLQGMCKHHNQAAYNRLRRAKDEGVKKNEREMQGRVLTVTVDSVPFSSQESKKNAEVEPVFRSWVIGKLVFNSGGPLLWDWFVVNGAEIFRVMQVTTTRYLEKLCSESGPCLWFEDEVDRRKKKFVKLKPEFWQPQNPRLAKLQTMTDQELLLRIRDLESRPESELERVEANMVLTSRRLEKVHGTGDLP